MHLLAMKTLRPTRRECRVAAKTAPEEREFIRQMSPILPDHESVATETDRRKAMEGADILVTATSAQAPLLEAAWMHPGSFYSHIGGWEDEYEVAKNCSKIVCDDWETGQPRTQTLSRMYQEGELTDDDIHADLEAVVAGEKPGRESDDERIYFNAVGLSFVDVAIALAMFRRALASEVGTRLVLQETTVFEHAGIAGYARMG